MNNNRVRAVDLAHRRADEEFIAAHTPPIHLPTYQQSSPSTHAAGRMQNQLFETHGDLLRTTVCHVP